MRASERENKREGSGGETGNINLSTAEEGKSSAPTHECRAPSRGIKVALCLREKAIGRVCFH